MRPAVAALVPLAAVLALTACSSESDGRSDGGATEDTRDPELPAPSSATEEPAEEPSPQLNDRGNIIKTFGQDGGMCAPGVDPCTEEKLVVRFTVDSAAVDPECTSGFSEPTENGHLVAITIRASTTPELTPDMFVSFSASDFRAIGPDGLTVSSLDTLAAYSCLDTSEMFMSGPLGPGQQYAGQVVIDSPTPTGSLVYAPAGTTGGWEWQF